MGHRVWLIDVEGGRALGHSEWAEGRSMCNVGWEPRKGGLQNPLLPFGGDLGESFTSGHLTSLSYQRELSQAYKHILRT